MAMRSPVGAVIALALLVVDVVTGTAMQTTASWPAFHATSHDQRTKADLFDLKDTPLKPNSSRGVGTEKDNLPGPPLSYAEFLQTRICSSDVAAIGTPRSQRAFLTSHETSIFTDYDVVVTEWLRGGPGNVQPVVPTVLTVTLDGGTIDTTNGPLEVVDDPPLSLNQPYILLLKRIPSTLSYQLEAAALTIGRTATALPGHRRVPPELLSGTRESSAVLADVRRLAAKCSQR